MAAFNRFHHIMIFESPSGIIFLIYSLYVCR